MACNELKEQLDNMQFIYNTELMTHPTHGILSLTNRCNLMCNYCFHTQSNLDIIFEIADQAAQYLIVNSVIMGEKPSIGFFGGEPLLCYQNIIKPLVEKYKDIFDWSITTNGTLLTEDIIDFFAEYNVHVLLSIDGCEIVQNTQRPCKNGDKSFALLTKNLPYLLLKKPDTTFRSTITKFSLKYLNEIPEMVVKYGFQNFTLIPNGFEIWDDKDYCLWRDFVDKEAIKIMRYILLEEKIPYQFTSLTDTYKTIFYQDIEPILKNPLSACGLGMKAIGISPTGDLFCCQEDNGKTASDCIGNIFTGIDSQKQKQYCLDYFTKWKKYVNDIKEKNVGTNNFKLYYANNFCSHRIKENFGFSNTYTFYLKGLHQSASKLFYNFYLSLNPNTIQYFNLEE